MSDQPERKRPKAPVPKNRRAPVPARKRAQADGAGGAPAPRPKAPQRKKPGEPGANPPAAAPDPAAQQAAAQQAAAQQAAAKRAAAQKAAQQQAAQQKAAAQQAAQQKAAAQQQAAAQAAAQKAALAAQKAAQAAAAQQAAAEQAAREAAALQAAAQGQPPAAPPRAAAPKAVPPKTAPRAAAPKAAAPRPAAPKAGAPRAAAPKAGAPKAGAPRAAAPKAGAPRAAGAAPARAPGRAAPGAGGRPARPGPGGRAAPAGARGKGAQPHPAAAHADLEDGDEQSFTTKPKSSPIPLIGGILAVLVMAVLGVVMFGGGNEPPPVVTEEEDKEPPVDPRIEESNKMLARVKEYQKADPTDFAGITDQLDWIIRAYGGFEAASEATKIRSGVVDSWRTAVQTARTNIENEVDKHEKALEFKKALAALENPPDIFLGADEMFDSNNSVFDWIRQKRRDLKTLSEAKITFEELKVKAVKYATKRYLDIAFAILEEFPPKYEENALPIWLLKEELVREIRETGIEDFINSAAMAAALRKQREEEKILAAAKARKEQWAARLSKARWEGQLNRHNLYNWVITSDFRSPDPQWRVADREGVGVLVGENRGGSMYIGTFNNHWLDYQMEFELRLVEGSLSFSPRTISQGPGVNDETTPPLEFSEDTGVRLNSWTKITVTVNGESVEAQIQGRSEPLVLDPELTRIPTKGGFLFRLPSDSRVEIRNIRAKVVNSTRDSFGK